MGRKNAANAAAIPTENYRKQIGKEQWKHNKKDIKEAKKHADAKKASEGWQYQGLLVLISLCALLAGIYLLFYLYLAAPVKKPS